MSGHSKWATTHRQKAVTDSKRAAIFTKIAKNITVAARLGGGDPTMNFRLRLAIDQGKTANMPKDNIERAIKRGTGEGDDGQIEELTYEAFGPGGVGILIHCLTDNRNRTSSSIKHILSKHGGALAGPNAVSRFFEKRGVIVCAELNQELELAVIDAGVTDTQTTDGQSTLYMPPDKLRFVKELLEKTGIATQYAQVDNVALTTVPLTTEQQQSLQELLDVLDNDEDVDSFATNADTA